ncbi:hypothetical protein TNCV_3969891 [Trichonephila clavipes]|nr:hypothetical protein TNCV_3969891 [Trichonephila clavipes]
MAKVSKRWAGTGVCSSPEGFGFEALHLMQSRIVLYRRHLRMGYRDRRTISRGNVVLPKIFAASPWSPGRTSDVVKIFQLISRLTFLGNKFFPDIQTIEIRMIPLLVSFDFQGFSLDLEGLRRNTSNFFRDSKVSLPRSRAKTRFLAFGCTPYGTALTRTPADAVDRGPRETQQENPKHTKKRRNRQGLYDKYTKRFQHIKIFTELDSFAIMCKTPLRHPEGLFFLQ